jgi:hypothetical protein
MRILQIAPLLLFSGIAGAQVVQAAKIQPE